MRAEKKKTKTKKIQIKRNKGKKEPQNIEQGISNVEVGYFRTEVSLMLERKLLPSAFEIPCSIFCGSFGHYKSPNP
jgi:signal transduction protein with GAF and PtsI domain